MSQETQSAHPFERRPHHTIVTLSIPVMLSLIAEPVAGVVDTAFVERLGAAQAAGLGAATALLSSVLWVFNFLGIGSQTEVAHLLGKERADEGRRVASLALCLALALGSGVAVVSWLALDSAVDWMSADPAVRLAMARYLGIRLLGVPAALVMLVAFGVLRGLQDMRTPLVVAAGMSAANIGLDAVLIHGAGAVPGFGIAGAAVATVASQLAAAGLATYLVIVRLGFTLELEWRRSRDLLVVGRDMFMRTAALLLFLLVGTRVAVQLGPAAGAAHQAMRQAWMLTAFMLDAFAATAQSLIGYFLGASRPALARRVAALCSLWSLATGSAIGLLFWLGEDAVAALLVPEEAGSLFAAAWPVCALSQPWNALAFTTDGIHWGARDYAYIRNGMLIASGLGIAALVSLRADPRTALVAVWLITGAWIALRAIWGMIRIWPGMGAAPLGRR